MLEREFIYIWYYLTVLFEQIAPYWILGIVVGSIVSVFGKSKINDLLREVSHLKLGILGVIPAGFLGIVSPLCMYGTIPIVASFARKGMREDWLAAFMMSSILLNPQLLIFSAVLGSKVFVLRIIASLLTGIIAGILVHFFFRNKSIFKFTGFSESSNRDTHPNLFFRLLKNIWRNIKATGLYFMAGIVLTALFQRYVPGDGFAELFGNQKGMGVLLAATLGVPLYVCGGGTIPLLLDWLQRGMSLGAATTFMVIGPATKITNLGALKIIFSTRNFFIYFLFVVVISILTGVFVDLIFVT
jgi:uncharacterized membrane protein YraQ (UPF0718 family)